MWDRTTDHTVNEFKTFAACLGTYAQEDFAKLTGATGLFFMPVMTFCGTGDSFPVGNTWRAGTNFNMVTILHAFQRDTQVQLAQPSHNGLIQFLIVFNNKTRVFFLQTLECGREFLFLAATLGIHRESIHGFRKIQRFEVIAILIMRVVKYHVIMNVINFGYGTDIARNTSVNLIMLATLYAKQMTHFERLAGIANQQL